MLDSQQNLIDAIDDTLTAFARLKELIMLSPDKPANKIRFAFLYLRVSDALCAFYDAKSTYEKEVAGAETPCDSKDKNTYTDIILLEEKK